MPRMVSTVRTLRIHRFFQDRFNIFQPKAFYDVVQGSALRPDLIAFVDWFEPPVGVVLGSIIAATLVLLATVGRIRGSESEGEAVDTH